MQDLRDRTYYLSNGVIRVGGRRVATNAANFTKGDTVGVVLDADQGDIVFFRNGERAPGAAVPGCCSTRGVSAPSLPVPACLHSAATCASAARTRGDGVRPKRVRRGTRAGVEQGRARGIRGRLFPFVSCDSEGDQITLLGSYSLLLNRIPRQLADMVRVLWFGDMGA